CPLRVPFPLDPGAPSRRRSFARRLLRAPPRRLAPPASPFSPLFLHSLALLQHVYRVPRRASIAAGLPRDSAGSLPSVSRSLHVHCVDHTLTPNVP
ncbi:hypothetical protein B0H16DRAFT_1891716, partial [Mycena metata]